MEDWSLVRTKDGKAGWVLTRNLHFSIPDEVAQYAEGHRITSYFSLGEVRDGDEVKHNWLWTTIAKGGEPYQFDSFRVFVWSRRRHRYETAYIERNLRGYYPTLVHPVTLSSRRGHYESPGFSVIVEDKDGVRQRRTYAFQGYRVGLISKKPYLPPTGIEEPPKSPFPSDARPAEPRPVLERMSRVVSDWWNRLRGK